MKTQLFQPIRNWVKHISFIRNSVILLAGVAKAQQKKQGYLNPLHDYTTVYELKPLAPSGLVPAALTIGNTAIGTTNFKTSFMRTFLRKSGVFATALLFANLLFAISTFAQTSVTFNNPANNGQPANTFTAPPGVTSITVQAWGGGAGGGNQSFRGSGGGGGGAFAQSTITITPSVAPQTFPVVVGAGGAVNVSGGNSSFNTSSVVAAGGGRSTGTAGGPGGTTAASTGTITRAGGSGGDGVNATNGGGGGGGSSASSTPATGVDGSDASGGTGGNGGNQDANGGDGGRGSNNGGTNSANGSAPGGGGGGNSDDDADNASGAAGQVIVTYTCPTYSVSGISAVTPICVAAGTSVVTVTSSAAGLPIGTYTVTYNRSSPSATGLTATMTVTTAGTGSFTATGLTTAGNATITVTNITGGACSSTVNSVSNTIVVSPLPTITLGTISSICAGATSFTIPYTVGAGSPNQYSISGTGITTVTNGTLSGGVINVTLTSPASAGSIPFTITVRNSALNCVSNTINGSVSATQPTVNLSTSSICIGSTTTILSPTSGGTWVSNNPGVATVTNAGEVHAVAAGTATFTFTLTSTGCTNTTSPLTVDATCQVITLTQPDQLTATISGDATICIGQSTPVTVSIAGGTAPYIINGVQQTGAGPFTINVSPTTTTTYDNTNIVITDANNCTSTTTGSAVITVNTNAALTSVTVPLPPTLCIGGTTTATANGAILGGGIGGWSITGGNSIDGSGNITPVNPGPATITYTITGGCGGTVSKSTSIFVLPNSSVASVTGTSPLCVGATALYTANGQVQSGGTGTWSSDNTNVATVDPTSGMVTATGPGTANIIFTISGGCNGPASAQQSLTVNAAPEITTQPSAQTVTYGAASVSFAVAPTTDPFIPVPGYQWQVNTGSGFNNIPGETSPILTINSPTVAMNGYSYHVILSNDCGSKTSNDVSLTVNPLPVTVTADPGQTKVYGDANPAAYTYTSVPAVSSSLANGDVISFTGSLSRVSGESVGTYAIGQNDLANDNYSITYNADNFSITPLGVTVTADPGQTKVYGDANPAAYTYTSVPAVGSSLANGDMISFTGSLSRVSGESVGTYAIGQNDLANDNYSITYNANDFAITPLSVTVTADPGQTKVYGDADPAAYTYTSVPPVGSSLANGDVVSFTGALSRAPGEAAGTYAIGQNDLTNSNYSPINYVGDNFTITNIPIIASADADPIECVGGTTSLTVTASGGDGTLQYSIDGGVTYQPGNIFTVDAAGSPYVVIVKDEDGFTVNTNTVTVTEKPSPDISLTSGAESAEQIICIGNPIVDITYSIGGNITGATVTALPSGLSGSFSGGVFTITGTPAAPGVYPYTVTTTGPCVNVSLSGTITVNDNSTISLSSASGTDEQTICINTAIDNITYSIGGGATDATVGGLPNGLTGTYNAGVFTISGTPTVSGTFNYAVTTAGPCDNPTATGTITVNGNSSISLSSSVESTLQTVCINNPITAITYDIDDGATGGVATGLPDGVTGTYNAGVFTISGSPTESGTFNYTVSTEGPCNNLSLSGTITVNANSTISLSSVAGTDAQTVCINNPISVVSYAIGGDGTGASITAGALPDGVTGSYNDGVFTITGTPVESGIFNYTITTTGPCVNPSISGTITVNDNSTISLSSGIGTDGQTICINNAINDITYAIGGGGTSASITSGALPAGVTGSYNAGVFTISGTPTEAGTYNYTVTTDGPCINVSLSGTITINDDATISLTSGPGTQSVCVNNNIISVAYTAGGSATNASITAGSLPAGVTGSYSGGVFTISGVPTESGVFNYTVTTAGPCLNQSVNGTITVNPLPLVNPVSNASYCNNSAGAGISFSTPTPGIVTYNWTSTADVGFGTNGTGNISAYTATNTTNSVITATVSVTATINGCTGPATTFTVTVSPSPVINPVSNLIYCNNGTGSGINFSSPVTGGTITYNWTSSVNVGFGLNGSGNIGSFTAVNNSFSPLVATVTVTPSLNGCTGLPISFTVTVNPNANAGTISGSATICTGSATQLSTNGSIGGTWSSTNPTIASVDPSTGEVTGLAAGSTTIFYTVSNICGAASSSFTVSVNANATAGTINGPATICAGSSTLLTSNGNSGGTWYTISPNITISPAGMITGLSAGTATVYYYVLNNCGFDLSLPYNVTVVAASNPGTIIGPASLCAGTVNLFFTTGTPGGTWASSNPSVANIGTTSGFALALTPGTTIFSYTVASNSCSSGSQTAYFTLTVNPGGNPGIISGLSTICAGTSTVLNTTGSSGGTWSSGNTSIATVDPNTGMVTGVAPGNVVITYHVSNTCVIGTGNATFNMTVSPGANAGTISGPSSVCVGSPISLTTNGTPGGSWSSSNTSVAIVDSYGQVVGQGAGSAIITYSVTSACATSSVSTNITVSALPNPGTVTGASAVCAGLSTTFTSNGNSGGTWSSSNPAAATVNAASGVVTGVAAGNATITYSVTTVCGIASQSANITVNPVLNAGTISGGSTVCIGSTINLSSTGNSGGTWSSSNTAVATVNASSGVVTSVTPGNTTITYTLSNSCGTSTATQLITVNAVANAGTISGATSVCSGLSTTFTSNGTSGGSWSSSNPAVAIVNATNGVITGVAAGNATITYTVTTGCGTASASANITVNPNPDAGTISGPSAVCVGHPINLTSNISGGTWASNSPSIATVNSSGQVSGVAAGTATITYTISTTCGSSVATYPVTVNSVPFAGIMAGPSSICVGSSAFFTQTGGATDGIWKSTKPAVATVDPVTGEVTAISAGNTVIVYTVTNSCGSSNAAQTVFVNSLPNAGTINGLSSVCAGANINLSASGDAGGTWSSNNTLVATVNPTTGVVTGVAEGSATIIYTVGSAAVCGTSSATHLVTVNPLANAGTISGATTVCAGLSTTLTSNGSVGGTWSSSNPAVATVNAASGVVTALSAGNTTINYTVTNICGSTTASVIVTVNPVPNAGVISGATSVCIGSTINLSSNISGGTWSSSANTVATIDPITGIVSGVGAGNTTITYTVTTGCGTAITTYPITVNPLPSSGTISGTTHICTGSTTTLSNNISGGTWSSSNTSAATVNPITGVVTGVAAGSSTITYTVSSVCGTVSTSVIVTIGDLPNAGTVSGASTLCVNSTAIFTSNGTGGGSWSSNNTSAATVDPITGVVTGVSAGSATIIYTVSSTCGSSVSSANITISALPNAGSVSGSSEVCVGATTALITNGTSGGIWSSNNNLVASVNSTTGLVTGVGAGSATITYTVTNTCGTNNATMNVTVNALPNSGIVSGAASLCAGLTTAFTSTGTGGGSWSSSNTSIATVDAVTGAVTGVAAGSATISYTVSSASCGTSISSANITINPSPNPGTISGSASVCAGSTTTFTSDGATNGSWSSDNTSVASVDANGVVTGVAAGTTTITYSVTNGCGTLQAIKVITVNPLPNAGIVSGSATLCAGGATTTYTSDGLNGGVWSSDNTSVATVNATSGLVTSVSAGTANIIYTVTTPCGTATASANITVIILPNAGTVSGATTVCQGSTTTYTSDGLSGGTWSSVTPSVATVDATTGVVTGVSAGNATIVYSFTNSCGTSTATQMITVNSLPNAGTVSGAATVCIGSQATFSSDGLSGGTWSSSNTSAASVDPVTGVVTGVAAGNATITYTSNTSCGTATASADITVVPIPDAGTVSGNTTVCVGATTTYTSSGMSGGNWSSVTPSVATVDAVSGIVTGVSAGNATIIYTFTNSCGSSSASQMITVNPLPNAGTVTGAPAVCAGSQATFTSNGLSGGSWSTSDAAIASVNPTTGVVIGVAPGSAVITYTSTTACGTASASANITVNPVLSAGTVSGSNTVCIGSTTPYTSDGSAGGTWSSVTPSVATVNPTTGIVTGISTGNATIVYTVSSSCGTSSSSKMIAVSLAANPGSLSGPSSVCTGSSVTFTRSGGSSGGTWSSSNTSVATVSSSGIVTGVSSGTAVISYSVASSCGMNSITKSITVNASLTLTATNINASTDLNECSALITLGSNITVTGSPTTLEYRIGLLWFSYPISSTYRFYRGTTPVTVRATNSCGSVTRLFLVTVTDNEPPVIECKPDAVRTANGSKYPVHGNEFNATASDGCGVASLIYSLSGATVDNFNSNNRKLNNVKLNVGTTIITWKATDVNGNVSTCSTVVTVNNNNNLRSSNSGTPTVTSNSNAKVNMLNTKPLTVKVAPNPTSYYFTLGFQSGSNEKMKLIVTDIVGKIIEQRTDIPANSTIQLGSRYHFGVYIAEIIQGKERVTLRLVKGRD